MAKKTNKSTAPRLYPKARRRIIEIWKYTCQEWGKRQADKYIRGLYAYMDALPDKRDMWRALNHEALPGVYFMRYEHHFIFFKEFSGSTLGVMSVLHENMDIPNRLFDDIE